MRSVAALAICTVWSAVAPAQHAMPPSRTMADGRTWTTGNLAITTRESYCYGDAPSSCRTYGRLYRWDVAVSACHDLGAGWRLPTADEWMRLAQAYGGGSGEDGRLGSAAYDALLTGGRSGFAAVLGGGRDEAGSYARADAHGFYWTSTESTAGKAIFMNFGKGSRGLYRQQGGDKGDAFAVRCIRD